MGTCNWNCYCSIGLCMLFLFWTGESILAINGMNVSPYLLVLIVEAIAGSLIYYSTK